MSVKNSATLAASIIVIGLILLDIVLVLLPPLEAKALVAEGGVVESLSVAVLGLGVVAAVLKTWRSSSTVWGAVAIMLLWSVLRELDYQKMFTPRSIESLGFYSSSKIPLASKLLALIALFPFAVAGLYLLVSAVKAIRSSPRDAKVWFPSALVAVGLLGVAQLSEKLLPARFHIVEETSELALAAFLVFLVLSEPYIPRASAVDKVQAT